MAIIRGSPMTLVSLIIISYLRLSYAFSASTSFYLNLESYFEINGSILEPKLKEKIIGLSKSHLAEDIHVWLHSCISNLDIEYLGLRLIKWDFSELKIESIFAVSIERDLLDKFKMIPSFNAVNINILNEPALGSTIRLWIFMYLWILTVNVGLTGRYSIPYWSIS